MHSQPLTAEEFTRNSLRMRNLPANFRQLQQNKEFPRWGGGGGQEFGGILPADEVTVSAGSPRRRNNPCRAARDVRHCTTM